MANCDLCIVRNRAICEALDAHEVEALWSIGRSRTLVAGIARWASFFQIASSQNVYPKTMDYKAAYTLQFLPTGVK